MGNTKASLGIYVLTIISHIPNTIIYYATISVSALITYANLLTPALGLKQSNDRRSYFSPSIIAADKK